MAAAPRPIRIEYQAKGFATGLTDVKAQIYVNGVAKAVGSNAVALTEVDSTNSPGLYELVITQAMQTSYGIAAGAENTISGYSNSVSKPLYAPFRVQVSYYNPDDVMSLLGTPVTASFAGDIAAIQTKLGTPAGASVSADVAAVKTDTAAIKADLETGSASLQTILTNVQSLQNASIGNGVGFVLPTLLIPSVNGGNAQIFTVSSANATVGATYTNNGVTFTVLATISAGTTLLMSGVGAPTASGTLTKASGTGDSTITFSAAVSQNLYKIPLTVQNDVGALIDPTSNSMTVTVANQSGLDRGSFLIGASGSPYSVAATRASVGQYYAYILVPSSEIEEELQFNFAYQVGSNPMVRIGVAQTLVDAAAQGYALQATLVATQNTVNSINSAITNATSGLVALYNLLTSGTFGLSALQSILTNSTYGLSQLQSILANSTYGLNALYTLLTNLQTSVNTTNSNVVSGLGSGFTAGTDDLHSLSVYLRANLVVGGRCV